MDKNTKDKNKRIVGVTVAIVFTTIFVVPFAALFWESNDEAEDIVEEYLSALRDGEMRDVIESVGLPERVADSELMSSLFETPEWDFTINDSHEVDDYVEVAYEISFEYGSDTGKFLLDDSQGWEILNQHVLVDTNKLPIDYVDIGDLMADEVYVFPGVYEMYTMDSQYVDVEKTPRALTTDYEYSADTGWDEKAVALDMEFQLTSEGAANIAEAAERWIEQCATEGPIEGPANLSVSEFVEIHDDSTRCQLDPIDFDDRLFDLADQEELNVRDIEFVNWELAVTPRFEVSLAGDELSIEVQRPGHGAVIAEVVDEGFITATCAIDLNEIDVAVTGISSLEFSGGKNPFNCRLCL